MTMWIPYKGRPDEHKSQARDVPQRARYCRICGAQIVKGSRCQKCTAK